MKCELKQHKNWHITALLVQLVDLHKNPFKKNFSITDKSVSAHSYLSPETVGCIWQ